MDNVDAKHALADQPDETEAESELAANPELVAQIERALSDPDDEGGAQASVTVAVTLTVRDGA